MPTTRLNASNVSHGHVVQARWYALRVRSRADSAVRSALSTAGVEAWAPTYDEKVAWTDRTQVVTRPLFAGYVFARFSRSDAASVAQTRGVVGILGTGNNEYSEIDDGVIENLKRVAALPADVSPGAYVAGEAVRVARGPFAGIIACVMRVKGATVLTIPVPILGRSVSVQIDAADVEAAPA